MPRRFAGGTVTERETEVTLRPHRQNHLPNAGPGPLGFEIDFYIQN